MRFTSVRRARADAAPGPLREPSGSGARLSIPGPAFQSADLVYVASHPSFATSGEVVTSPRRTSRRMRQLARSSTSTSIVRKSPTRTPSTRKGPVVPRVPQPVRPHPALGFVGLRSLRCATALGGSIQTGTVISYSISAYVHRGRRYSAEVQTDQSQLKPAAQALA